MVEGVSHSGLDVKHSGESETSSISAIGVRPAFDTADGWWRVIEACGPPSLLLVIEHRLGDLRRFFTAEDILQESLLRAWRARATVEWRGQRAFRAWLLTVIDHCILDGRDHVVAAKRG